LSEKNELELMVNTLKQEKASGRHIAFVVIDSIRGMQKGSLNDDAVGEAMMAINSEVCEALGATACYIHHGKKNDQDIAAMDALLGSVTIVNCVRHALFLRKKSNRTRTVEVCKSNLGFEDHLFTSSLNNNRIILDHKGEIGSDDGEPVDQSQLDKAEMLLLAQLGKGDAVPAREIYQTGEFDGISVETIKKAKKMYVIKTFQRQRKWFWQMAIDKNGNPRVRADLK
jgi:RecA-family ATPase